MKFSAEKELLRQNLNIFKKYNEDKLQFLYKQLLVKKRIVFDLIPLLLHYKAEGLLPCPDACQISPHGVHGFSLTPEIEKAFRKAFSGTSLPKDNKNISRPKSLPIKSVCLMGSMGSVAQSGKSDLDYWLCLDMEGLDIESMEYFQEKLLAIEKWADDYADIEVHCFPLSIEDIKKNEFGSVDAESSGSAQGKLLKEEFYRSLTLVTGQIPLWWIMPTGIKDDEYERIKNSLENSQAIDSEEILDLGNVHEIDLSEFYGAAIWQINKTLGSPFKSVLKMALLEDYLFSQHEKGLISTELKERLFSKAETALSIDPYILMFDRASEYFKEKMRFQDLDLLRRSFYLKAGVKVNIKENIKRDLTRKQEIMYEYVREWDWPLPTVDTLNKYEQWTFKEIQDFNSEIHRFIIKTYKNISSDLKEKAQESGPNISPRDLTILGRKLFVYYSRRTNKVDSILSVVDDPPVLPSVTFQQVIAGNNELTWMAFRGLHSRDDVLNEAVSQYHLKSSPFLPELLSWLVYNRIYGPDTSINLNPGHAVRSLPFTLQDIISLFKALTVFFETTVNQKIAEDNFLDSPKIRSLFLIMNFGAPENKREIQNTALCYVNNWGEVFFKGFDSDRGIHVARDFIRRNFAYDLTGARENLTVYLFRPEMKSYLGPKLEKFFGFKVLS